MLSWSNCFFFYQWLTNFSRLLPIFSETLSPPLNFLFSGFFLPSHVLLFSSIASLSSPYRVATFTFFSHGLLPARILHASHLFYFSSFLFSIFFVLPRLPASSSSSNHCNRIARFGNHQARVNVATSPPTAAPARFAPRTLAFTFYLRLFLLYSPVFHSWSSARFFVRSFLLFSHAFQFPHLYCLIFHAFFSLWAWSSVDLAHAILKHFFTTLPCNFFTKHSTSVDASILCTIVFLRVACS